MTKIRVTKEFSFEMAHALWNYDGACRNIHGHSYHLSVTLLGDTLYDPSSPKNGMVVDFGDIKKWVKNEIVDELDHSLLISREALEDGMLKDHQMFGKVKILDFQPTCENLLPYIAAQIRALLPPNLSLFSLKLRETDSSYAEWYASDNE